MVHITAKVTAIAVLWFRMQRERAQNKGRWSDLSMKESNRIVAYNCAISLHLPVDVWFENINIIQNPFIYMYLKKICVLNIIFIIRKFCSCLIMTVVNLNQKKTKYFKILGGQQINHLF